MVRDTRSIEIKDFKEKGAKEIKIKDSNAQPNVEKYAESSLVSKIASFKSKQMASLISKARLKHSKKSNESTDSIGPKPIKRSRSEEEFSNLKPKRSSRLSQDLSHTANGNLVNSQLYSREIIMSRAKRKTLKVTILIVVSFV